MMTRGASYDRRPTYRCSSIGFWTIRRRSLNDSEEQCFAVGLFGIASAEERFQDRWKLSTSGRVSQGLPIDLAILGDS